MNNKKVVLTKTDLIGYGGGAAAISAIIMVFTVFFG